MNMKNVNSLNLHQSPKSLRQRCQLGLLFQEAACHGLQLVGLSASKHRDRSSESGNLNCCWTCDGHDAGPFTISKHVTSFDCVSENVSFQ